MSRWNARELSVQLSARLYQMLLFVYPAAFRQQFGSEMVQVFRVACRHSVARGSRSLVHFWVEALADLVASGSAERLAEMRPRSGQHRPYLYVGALILSLVTGYVHLCADADALAIVLLLGGAFGFGLACPVAAWRWALILGMGIPAALLVGHGLEVRAVPHRDTDLPVLAPLVPALLGVYTGAFMHRVFPRLATSSRFSRQQPL
jgi:hypothetical protein